MRLAIDHVDSVAPDVHSTAELVAGGWIADYSRYSEQDFRENASCTFPGYESATWFRCTEIDATLGRSRPDTTTRTVACPDSIRRAMPKDFHQG